MKGNQMPSSLLVQESHHVSAGSSVLTAEAKAIDLALDLVDNCFVCLFVLRF